MNESRFMVDHVRVTTDQPFEEVAKGIERQLGDSTRTWTNHSLWAATRNGQSEDRSDGGDERLHAVRHANHGSMLRIVGKARKAVQYVVGNPLFAVQMTQHDIRASLYAPLRVLLYENEEGKTCLEYDKPSSLFGQFGNAEITAVATMLDRKLEDLVAKAIGKEVDSG